MSNKCPGCHKYIFGTWCYACKEDITKMQSDVLETLKRMMGMENK